MATVFLNGKFLPEAEATLPVIDLGFQYGDGVFTTIRVTNGHAELLEYHRKRLTQSCAQLRILPPLFDLSWVNELIRLNQAHEGVWRLKILLSAAASFLTPGDRSVGSFVMTIKPYTHPIPDAYRLCVYPDLCVRPLSRFKTLGYLDRFVIRDYALKSGFDDALVLSSEGAIMETAFSNFFWIDGNTFYYPHTDLSYMPGVALQAALEVVSLRGLTSQPIKMSPQQIVPKVRLFVCNAMTGVRPVAELDGRRYVVDHEFAEWVNSLPK